MSFIPFLKLTYESACLNTLNRTLSEPHVTHLEMGKTLIVAKITDRKQWNCQKRDLPLNFLARGSIIQDLPIKTLTQRKIPQYSKEGLWHILWRGEHET